MQFMNQPNGEYKVQWDIEGEKLSLGITSLHIRDAISDLMDLPGMSQKIALALVDAGFRSVDSLRGMDEEKLAAIPGLTRPDAKKIVHALSRKDAAADRCVACNGPVDEKGLCPKCGKSPVSTEPLPKERMLPLLMRIPRVNQLKAEMLYDAGYFNPEKMKNASKDDLSNVKGLGSKTIDSILAYVAEGNLEKSMPCKKCGVTVGPDMLICPNCGMAVLMEEEAEDEAPTMVEKRAVVDLERSFSYLIKEDRSDRAYAYFEKEIGKGLKGYCVTRNYPVKIKSKFDIGSTPIVWLSNVGKEDSLRPKDLEKLSYSLEQFLANGGGIVLLDGLEYLITNNNFLTVLRFVQSLRDQVAINHSILLMVLNPSTLDPHEMNLLEKEVDGTL
jgi:RNA polymerase subunit RPABC4/transcription elongation factor Spt4